MEPEVDTPTLGVIAADRNSDRPLVRAAAQQRTLPTRAIEPDEPAVAQVAGLVVDVPIGERAELIARLTHTWRVPLLIESPIAADLEQTRPVASLADDDAVVAANPLRYGLHTRRLIEALQAGDDPLQTCFVAWRFRSRAAPPSALPQLLDLLGALAPGEVRRISALARRDPAVLIATLRYASGVIGSLEVGDHLAADSFPAPSELIVECCTSVRAFHCAPGQQTVRVYGQAASSRDWQPDPADAMVAAFAGWLRGGPRPAGHIRDDLRTLALVHRIREAAATDQVILAV
jgi:hypothetical protein